MGVSNLTQGALVNGGKIILIEAEWRQKLQHVRLLLIGLVDVRLFKKRVSAI